MTLDALTPEEREVVRRALEATFAHLLEPYGEMEYHLRLGVRPAEVRELLGTFPEIDESPSSTARLAIHIAFNDLLRGVGLDEATCRTALGVSLTEAMRIERKWSLSHDGPWGGLR